MLFEPPGTGKALIARQLPRIVPAKEVEVVNGPEIFSKWVGESEEKIRKLFEKAETDSKILKGNSGLHVIIFDEFDAIAKKRDLMSDEMSVSYNVVNWLLSKMDGVNKLNNILLIALTNRLDLTDPAILRPGRFEVIVEVNLPNLQGR